MVIKSDKNDNITTIILVVVVVCTYIYYTIYYTLTGVERLVLKSTFYEFHLA